jgi:hypothetical protein
VHIAGALERIIFGGDELPFEVYRTKKLKCSASLTISRWSKVVPLRAWPTTNTGFSMRTR